MADEVSIPEAWRVAVLAALRSGEDDRVIVRDRPRKEWFSLFPDEWEMDLPRALATALGSQVKTGVQNFNMLEPGETWAFMFVHRNIPLYGKINLQPDGRVVIVYSAHIPQREKL